MKKSILTILFFLIVIVLNSCLDKFDFSTDNLSTSIDQSSEWAIPLVDASFTVDELLSTQTDLEKYLSIDQNNFVSIIYQYDLQAYPASDFFNGNFSGTDLPYYADVLNTQTVNFGFDKFDNLGEVYLKDPKMTFSILNYWNVATRFRFRDFYYYKTESSPGIPVTGPVVNNWINVDLPVSPAVMAITEIEFNKTNSNIDSVISSLPHHVTFAGDFETIPGGPFTIDPGSADSVKLKINVPLDLRVSDLVMHDTLEFKLGDQVGDDTSKISSLQLNVICDNGYPMDLELQLYFTDENYIITDSLSNTGIFIGSGVVENGLVTESTKTTNIIKIEGEKKINILQSEFIILYAWFKTANADLDENVKIYSTYTLGLKLGALVKLNIKI
ncbi:MAG: hypothetical protein U0W24_16795 [Bacteroidales bacterium]